MLALGDTRPRQLVDFDIFLAPHRLGRCSRRHNLIPNFVDIGRYLATINRTPHSVHALCDFFAGVVPQSVVAIKGLHKNLVLVRGSYGCFGRCDVCVLGGELHLAVLLDLYHWVRLGFCVRGSTVERVGLSDCHWAGFF